MSGILTFFNLDSFSTGDLLTVATLVVLEGLLSCDNAIALAMMVRRLPAHQQGKALRYGIIGAYFFQFTALLLAKWIVSQWYLKILGGAYLLWMAGNHLLKPGKRDEEALNADADAPKQRRFLGLSAFWSTVLLVEATDIAFSVDSIAVAVALSSKLWVLFLGAIICVLCIRFAAQGFIKLLAIFPRLEIFAFVAVAIIGIKLVVEFPMDVVGQTRQLPAGATYRTAAQYQDLVHQHHHPSVHIHGVITITTAAIEAPLESAFGPADDRGAQAEYGRARSFWLHEGRQLIHVNEWVASALIILTLALGFLKRAPPPPLHGHAGIVAPTTSGDPTTKRNGPEG